MMKHGPSTRGSIYYISRCKSMHMHVYCYCKNDKHEQDTNGHNEGYHCCIDFPIPFCWAVCTRVRCKCAIPFGSLEHAMKFLLTNEAAISPHLNLRASQFLLYNGLHFTPLVDSVASLCIACLPLLMQGRLDSCLSTTALSHLYWADIRADYFSFPMQIRWEYLQCKLIHEGLPRHNGRDE